MLQHTELIHEGVTAVGIGEHLCAIVRGALLCWGNTAYGDIDDGTKAIFKPREVFHEHVTAVSVSSIYACAIVQESLYCWGENRNGNIGNGLDKSYGSVKPVKVIASGVSAVFTGESGQAGENSSCAIVRDALFCWGANFRGQIDPSTAGYSERGIANNVLAPKQILFAGVSDYAFGEIDNRCMLVNHALRCRGRRDNHQLLLWPSLPIEALPITTGFGDIKSIGPDTLAELTADSNKEIERLSNVVTRTLQGKLVSDGNSIFSVNKTKISIDVDSSGTDFDLTVGAIPLYPVESLSEVKDSTGKLLYVIGAISMEAHCGESKRRADQPNGDQWLLHSALYLQTGNQFIEFNSLSDAVKEMEPWSSFIFKRDMPLAGPIQFSDVEFNKFSDCSKSISDQWASRPFAAIRVSSTDWMQEVQPRVDATWHTDHDHPVTSVKIEPKVGVSFADFTVEAQRIVLMQCDGIILFSWKRGESLPLEMHRTEQEFSLDTAEIYEKIIMYEETLKLPSYTNKELKRAINIHRGLKGLASAEEAKACLPVLGVKFTVKYKSNEVQRIYGFLPSDLEIGD